MNLDIVIKWNLFFISIILFKIILYIVYLSNILNIHRILNGIIAITIRTMLANGCHKESIAVIARRRLIFFFLLWSIWKVWNIFFMKANLICDFCTKFHYFIVSRNSKIINLLCRHLSYGNTIRRIRLHLYRLFPMLIYCNVLVYGCWRLKKISESMHFIVF